MTWLYDILYKFREYLVFLLAVLLSFLLIFSNDNPHVQAFQAQTLEVLSAVQRPLLEWQRLGDLEAENQRLRNKITELSLQLQLRAEAELENQRLRKLLQFQEESQLEVQPAKIINRGTSPIVNSVTVNLGSTQGVRKNQAVVVSEGIVGKTVNVAEQSAVVQLLTDVNFRISVKNQRTRVTGVLLWERNNICSMKNVAKSLDVQTGDTVITSGYSDIFPEGLLVGEVVEVSNEIPGYHKRIRVRTFINFSELEEVFILTTPPEQVVLDR